jgi:hypothetical protein
MKRFVAVLLGCALGLCATAAAKFVTGTYQGKTSQRLPISVSITNSGMASASYSANYTCTQPGHAVHHANAVGTVLGPAPFSKPGKIDHKFSLLHGTDKIHFVAQALGNTLKGYFKETYIARSGASCKSGKVTFSLVK